jgi:hypothetical protein
MARGLISLPVAVRGVFRRGVRVPPEQVVGTIGGTKYGYDKEDAYGPALGLPVLVLMVTTSILGPVLTEHFAPRLLKDVTRCRRP